MGIPHNRSFPNISVLIFFVLSLCQSLDSGFASVGTPTIVTSTGIHMKQIKFGATPYFTHSLVPSSAMSSVESALEGSGSTASNSKRTSSSSGESADPRRAQAKPRAAH